MRRVRRLHGADDGYIHGILESSANQLRQTMPIEYLVEIAILVALVAPELRAASSTAYRRVFPFDAARIGAGALLYLAIVASVALYEPKWLRIPAIIVAATIAYLAWRARPGYGVAARLPPGSLQRLPIRPWSDPEFYKAQAERYGSIFKMSQF